MSLLNVSETAEALLLQYPNYYDTVDFGFIEEAVQNTFDDFHSKNQTRATLEEIHKHVIENYI